MTSTGLPVSEARRVYDDVRGAIGQTPLVRLQRVSRGIKCSLYAKLEIFNPGGSVKDRIAFRIIEAYERSGELKAGGTVVEATSGNTGIGLAIACALKGYKAIFVLPDKMSEDKVRMLRAFGARVIITPTAVAPEDPRSYYSVADRLVEEIPNSVLANQYHNPENPNSHYDMTAPEIWEQTEGRVTDIVVGMGTGGTITGLARYFRDENHDVKIVGVDPEGSILYEAWKQDGSGEGLEASTYKVEGIGEDFIPGTLDLDLVDEVIRVDDAESFLWTRRLVREEGIFAGGSSGSAVAGALKYAKDLPEERVVVVLLPDSGNRYLTKIFDDDWMREHGFLVAERRKASAMDVSSARGLPALLTATPDDLMTDVISRLRENGVDQLPVVADDGQLVGIVSEIELLEHMLSQEHEHPPDETIEGMVNPDVRTAEPEAPLSEILSDLMASKVVVLVDELGRPVGILTIIDALEFLAPLEEHEAVG
ncbi:MAG: cystathionine beta-synthase [Anaerolineales bacterium]